MHPHSRNSGPRLACATAVVLLVASTWAQGAEVVHISAVAPDVLAITVRSGDAVLGSQEPYVPMDGDRVQNPEHHRWVIRDGECIGSLVGSEGDTIHTLDRVIGDRLQIDGVDLAAELSIASETDPSFPGPTRPVAVHRKSLPTDLARVGPWQYDSPVEHHLYLQLPHRLQDGAEYEIGFGAVDLPSESYTHDWQSNRSDAVHVSHLGFRPDDPAKVAFLSCWMGDGGGLDYPAGQRFNVLRDDTGESVSTGTAILAKAADAADEDAYGSNHSRTDVYELDFSEISTPGTYRISVEGIGCSYPFVIGDDVWREAFRASARGFYHMRSGIELGPPCTDYIRPRCFHPDDGVTVFASTTTLMDTRNGLGDEPSNFAALVAGRTDQVVADAWGGYHDAGDWDRRIQHLKSSRLLLELADMFPEYIGQTDLNLPESDNHLPDAIDEALFNLDFYRRLQTPEGGIRGGIESSEHPRHGEASWQESLTVMAYAPGVWSSYQYAGVAARAAFILAELDPALSTAYRASALAAMAWAEEELPKRGGGDPHAVNDARNLAAIELYRLTGDGRWHELFLATTAFGEPGTALYKWQDHEQRDAAFVYLTLAADHTEAGVRSNCLSALRSEADARLARQNQTGFRWTGDPWRPVGWGGLSAPDGVSLGRAHYLTGDAKYLRGTVLACQTGAGANPLNMCYTTGLGHRSPQNPLHIDSRITHQPSPPGLTVFGPLDPRQVKQDWAQKEIDRTLYPDVAEWPSIECYWDVFWYPMISEFTIHQPMAENCYVWGYLAARG